MDLNKQKELYSLACISAISAQCAFTNVGFNTDLEGIDMGVRSTHASHNELFEPEIRFQVKCTSGVQISNGHFIYNLEVKNYKTLRLKSAIPRYLFLIVAPDDYLKWTEDCVCGAAMTSFMGFWFSLSGYPETKNTSTITVKIPLEQRLNYHSLRGLIHAANSGDDYHAIN